MAESLKSDFCKKLHDGKFLCLICNKTMATKQRVFTHLHKLHDLSPIKRVNKRYLDDESTAVPRSTRYRWKKRSNTSTFEDKQDEEEKEYNQYFTSGTSSGRKTVGNCNNIDQSNDGDHCHASDQFCADHLSKGTSTPEKTFQQNFCGGSMSMDGYSDDDFDDNVNSNDDLSDSHVTTDDESDLLSSSYSENHCEIFTDSDSSESVNNENINSPSSSNDTYGETLQSKTDHVLVSALPKKEFEALSLVSCFLRNKLSAATCKDVINTFKVTFPNCEELADLDFVKIMSSVESDGIKEFHYCILCNKIFPLDEDIFRCSTPNCEGLRYKGALSNQQIKGRQPKQCFVFTDIKKQLVSLLTTPGVWEDIQNNKEAAYERKAEATTVLTDITDGASYRAMMVEGGFLDKNKNNITAVFNTDGVNLYSSSQTQLWPIFLAINELSPYQRFARNNILLLGLWQGKGKPPIQEFLTVFTEEMNSLYTDGVEVHIDENIYSVKLLVLCCITDLPAKAEIMNMAYYNGEYGCITCEDPGITVKQGKGHAKCFPYRGPESRYPNRSHDKIIVDMNSGSEKKRSKGFKGTSNLINLKNYNIVDGAVPDYMHGVLLGVTKTLLVKWFSPSQSQKPHFIGKHIKVISKKMKNIKPPNNIERLPRDLEKHYLHFKATELQSWLLYYSVPCVNGFLGDEYMENLVCLAQAMYILLGDRISSTCLEKVVDLLEQFYASFQRLYGDGSCGLNVHNTVLHLPHYVKLWGPVWCWSCFPFEDANALLLQAVHGTGNVLKQVMKYRQAQIHISKKGLDLKKSSSWKTKEATNCDVAGAPQKLDESENWVKERLALLHPLDYNDAKRVHRIIVNGQKFFSEGYGRMQKRICSVVKYSYDSIGRIKFFIMCDNIVYAVMTKMETIRPSHLSGSPVISHLTAIKDSKTLVLVNVEELCEVLVFIDTKIQTNSSDPCYVCRLPNRYGHAVFK